MKYKIEIKVCDTETRLDSTLTFETSSLEDLIIPIGDLFESGALFAATTDTPSERPV